MAVWDLSDIPWDQFDPTKVDPDSLKIAKAAALTESNGLLYGEHLAVLFRDDPYFLTLVGDWGAEEEQHGMALGRWAQMADPSFDFADALSRFRAGYEIPSLGETSVRGSLVGEMVARCIVESGTSSLYSALRDHSEEPVFKAICGKIAADEFRHYKLFLTTLERLLQDQQVGAVRRILIALGRVRESEDDELSYAFHVANDAPDLPYQRKICATAYSGIAYALYRPEHAKRATRMMVKAVGLDPQGKLAAVLGEGIWRFVSRKAAQHRRATQEQSSIAA
ncbi:MAG: ferritin-like domain-containing protein [Rhodospirillaceae bacterium]